MVVGYAILLAWPMSTLGLISFAVRYAAAHRRQPARRPSPGALDGTPEHFWIIVPALNEERVVGNTVAAALSLGGFGGTLTRVLVVDDGSDDRTPEVLAGIEDPRLYVLRRDLPNPASERDGATYVVTAIEPYGYDPIRNELREDRDRA